MTSIHPIRGVCRLITLNTRVFLLHLIDIVWADSKQVGLIDSLFRNFYVPPVVFAVTKDEDGAIVRVCVDGKQVHYMLPPYYLRRAQVINPAFDLNTKVL